MKSDAPMAAITLADDHALVQLGKRLLADYISSGGALPAGLRASDTPPLVELTMAALGRGVLLAMAAPEYAAALVRLHGDPAGQQERMDDLRAFAQTHPLSAVSE